MIWVTCGVLVFWVLCVVSVLCAYWMSRVAVATYSLWAELIREEVEKRRVAKAVREELANCDD